jgi:hypothetical protein
LRRQLALERAGIAREDEAEADAALVAARRVVQVVRLARAA